MKDAYYFSHDANAKDDPKCVMMIEQLGLEGYGIFWVLIETLRDQPNYKYPLVLIPALARRYNTTAEKMRTVVMSYSLFEVDNEEQFFSLSLMQRMEKLDAKKEQARLAGLESAKKRLLLNGRSTDVEQTLNISSTIKVNKSKVNKSKYGEYAHVLLTQKEYENLSGKLGAETLCKCIKFLDEWIEEKGYKSKSHNLAIQRWVVDAVNKKNPKEQSNLPRREALPLL